MLNLRRRDIGPGAINLSDGKTGPRTVRFGEAARSMPYGRVYMSTRIRMSAVSMRRRSEIRTNERSCAAVRGLYPQVRGGRCRSGVDRAVSRLHNGFRRPTD